MNLIANDDLVLLAAHPALRLVGQNNRWVPAPGNPRAIATRGRDVRRLVQLGKLKFGNKSRTFVIPTEAP